MIYLLVGPLRIRNAKEVDKRGSLYMKNEKSNEGVIE